MAEKVPKRRAGGDARAKALSPEQRKEISARAAVARWSKDLPKATHEGEIKLGDSFSIPCAVLEDGTRVLTQQGMHVVLGRHKNITGRNGQHDERPTFLAASNLSPFISNDLKSTWEPVRFRMSAGSGGVGGIGIAIGYRAEILPMVCHVYEDAERAGKLLRSQLHIVEAARALSRAFSKTGIIALVDEATGFQYDRAKDALAKILERFIAKELQPWARTFPLEFYERICELNGWDFNAETMQGPRRLAQCTNDIIYQRLAPGVLDELRRKNPVVTTGKKPRRKHKHFQWFTGDIGHPKLLAHIEGVKILLRVSSSWEQFRTLLDQNYRKYVTTELGLEVESTKKPNSSSSQQLSQPTPDQPSAESSQMLPGLT
jgi:hypothetical protein